jgi:serine protease Do
MQMRDCGSLKLVVLMAGGLSVLYSGKTLLGAPISMGAELGSQMVAVAMGSSSSSHGRQGYLGVETRDLGDDAVVTLKVKDLRGVEIVSLDHDGPACKAGMRMHDVILQINGQAIDGEEQMRKTLRELPAGRTVNFVVSRDGQTQTMTLQMADRRMVEQQAWEQHYTVPAPGPNAPGEYGIRGNSFMGASSAAPSTIVTTPKGHRDFLGTSMILSSSFTGAKLEVMGEQLAEFFGAAGGAGLLVRSVDGNSPAEEAGLRAGDVVVRINSIPLSSGADWTKTVHDNKGKPVPVVVLRDRQEKTLTLTPDGKKRSSLLGFDLEEFFEQTSQQTRVLLAKL